MEYSTRHLIQYISIFSNEITKIYDEKYELMYHVGNRDNFT